MDNPKAPRIENDSNGEFFPFDIFIEILSRVSVKALGRLTVVCKSWHSLIKSEMFINMHLKNYTISIANGLIASNQFPNILVMPSYIDRLNNHPYSFFCDNTFLEHGTFSVPMLCCRPTLQFVGNSCNGIICFTDDKAYFGRRVFLCNPVLKKIKCISNDWFDDLKYSKLGFGFLECNSDFKVVRIHYVKDKNSKMLGEIPPEVEVYSLKADSWRRIEANIRCIVQYSSVSCNGAIYWLARKTDEWGCDAVMYFDLASELFHEIALPVEPNSFTEATILLYKGLPATWIDTLQNRDGGVKCYELWVLREYSTTKSWTKLSIFETDQTVGKVIGFTKSGKLIMETDSDMLASWDPMNNQQQHLKIKDSVNYIDGAFVESLTLYQGGNTSPVKEIGNR